jgi:hypothetical protein
MSIGCADYGQACMTTADCCNMVECLNGTCGGAPIP